MIIPTLTTLLLDRDGTLIRDRHYLADPAGVELLPGVAEALAVLSRKGMRFFMVSNQSGIGRGFFPVEAANAVNARLADLLGTYGIVFSDMVYCSHAPEERCLCRKPGTGMWEALKNRYGLNAATTLMLGDKEEDILFAANAGLALRGLVLTGKGKDTAQRLGVAPPEMPGTVFTPRPVGPSYPHLVLSSFTDLEAALSQVCAAREQACDA